MFKDRTFDEERFFRNSRRWASFHKGDLKYVILDILKDKPRHGYDIIWELEELSYGFYKPSPGVIYPTLQMLEEMGYASSNEQEGKKIYSITEEGLKFLDSQSNIAGGVRKQMKHKWSFKNIGKMIVVMKEYHALEHLLVSGFRSLDADKAEQIRQILLCFIRKLSQCCKNKTKEDFNGLLQNIGSDTRFLFKFILPHAPLGCYSC